MALIIHSTELPESHSTYYTRFRTLRVGQVFHYKGRWMIKRNQRWAEYADTKGNGKLCFKGITRVRIIRQYSHVDTALDLEILDAADLSR